MFSTIKRIYQDDRAFRATILLSILAGFVYLFLSKLSGVLWPFIVAIILASLLNPFVYRLKKFGLSRGFISALLIVFLVFIVLTIVVITSFFVQKYLVYYGKNINKTVAFIADWVPKTLSLITERIHFPVEIHAERIRQYLLNSFGVMTELFIHYVFSLFDTAKSVVGIFSFLFFVPVLTFYFLKDWPKLVAATKTYTPDAIIDFSKFALPHAKQALANQFKGQAKVALILMAIYAPCLFVLGLKPFLLLGIMSGLSTFIPFLGIFIAFLITFAAALGHGLSILSIILLSLLYFVGSSIESNFLTPKFIGEKVGIHPVWIFFSVFATIAFFGIGFAFFIMPIATITWSLIHSSLQWLNQMEKQRNKTPSSSV